MAQRPRASDRVLTVPNVLTFVRPLLIPVFLWLLLGEHNRVAAAGLLGLLGASDWVDGYVARHFNQESELGRILDPVSDRVLLVAAVIGLFIDGTAPRWVLVPVMAREVAVSIAVVALAAAGARRIDVTWFGKAGTFALMAAFPLFLLAGSVEVVHELLSAAAWVCAFAGLALSYYAAALYFPMARRALREGRAARAGVQSSA